MYCTCVTFAVAARCAGLEPAGREAGLAGTAWRFAVAIELPFPRQMLSVAPTARDIYDSRPHLGFGILTGLWAGEAPREDDAARQAGRVAVTSNTRPRQRARRGCGCR